MCRFLQKQKVTVKKLRSSQADKESTKKQRIEYWKKSGISPSENIVFLD
jgi:hypothetical protein